MIGDEIARAGGRVRGAKLVSRTAKTSAARALLEDADVVFVSGGDVLAGMSVLSDRGVIPVFHALAKAGRPMIGISAGSNHARARRGCISPDEEASSEPPVVFPCLGVAPVYVDAHAEEDDWAELRTLLDLVALRGEAGAVGYGLTRKGALRVDHGAAGAKLTAFGTATPKFVVKRKRVVAGTPLPLGASETVKLSKPVPRRRAAKRYAS